MAGAVDGIGRGLEGVAEDGVADVGSGHAGALERVASRDGAEVDGREVLQGAAEGPEPRADTGQEDDVCIGTLGLHGRKLRFSML